MTKRIDKLLKKVKEITFAKLCGLFTCNDDDFIQALGLDPENYKAGVDQEGNTLYDADKALNDSCALTWSEE